MFKKIVQKKQRGCIYDPTFSSSKHLWKIKIDFFDSVTIPQDRAICFFCFLNDQVIILHVYWDVFYFPISFWSFSICFQWEKLWGKFRPSPPPPKRRGDVQTAEVKDFAFSETGQICWYIFILFRRARTDYYSVMSDVSVPAAGAPPSPLPTLADFFIK